MCVTLQLDIDECDTEATNGCEVSATCVNIAGDYNCGCNPGYTLNSDGRTCNGK